MLLGDGSQLVDRAVDPAVGEALAFDVLGHEVVRLGAQLDVVDGAAQVVAKSVGRAELGSEFIWVPRDGTA